MGGVEVGVEGGVVGWRWSGGVEVGGVEVGMEWWGWRWGI